LSDIPKVLSDILKKFKGSNYIFIYKLFFLIKKGFYFLSSFTLLKTNAYDSKIKQNIIIIYMKVKHTVYHQQ